MSLRRFVKRLLPPGARPFAIKVYLRVRALYFRLYRAFFAPSGKYLAVAEQNYITGAPPEWTSVSLESADILINLESDYDFKLHDVRYAYSAHTIEHLTDNAVQRLFGKLFAAMRPGAVLRVECPDLDLLLDDYKCVHDRERKITRRIEEMYKAWHMERVDPRYAQPHQLMLAGIVSYTDSRTNMMMTPLCTAEEFEEKMRTLSNEEFGDWAVSLLTPEQLRDSYLHRNWFNFNKLQRMLTQAGFSGVVRCEPAGTHYGFRMNINRTHRAWCSIFIEAIKG
jgi:hypothetical protein